MAEKPPDVTTFNRQFRLKYGREMTAEEETFYNLTKNLLDNPPEEELDGGDQAA